jgi:hypothetical protein
LGSYRVKTFPDIILAVPAGDHYAAQTFSGIQINLRWLIGKRNLAIIPQKFLTATMERSINFWYNRNLAFGHCKAIFVNNIYLHKHTIGRKDKEKIK